MRTDERGMIGTNKEGKGGARNRNLGNERVVQEGEGKGRGGEG